MSHLEENENYLVELENEDGEKEIFEHLDTVKVGEDNYVICVPYLEEETDEIEEVVILKMVADPENPEGSLLLPEEDEAILVMAFELFVERNEERFDWTD